MCIRHKRTVCHASFDKESARTAEVDLVFLVAQPVSKQSVCLMFSNDQVQPVPEATVKRTVKDVATFSPVVTLEPRRRRFHQPVTLTMPLPPPLPSTATPVAEPFTEEVDPDNVRLLCSLTGKFVYSCHILQSMLIWYCRRSRHLSPTQNSLPRTKSKKEHCCGVET